MHRTHVRPVVQALVFFVLLGLIAAGIYTVLWLLDFGPSGEAPWVLLTDRGTAATMSGLGEVTVAVLGIAITVVAIIVELAANRYTPRITELFLRDPVNAVVLGFFTITAVLVLWVDLSMYGTVWPRWMVLAIATGMSVSLLAILPYLVYVFDFLSPTGVIQRIERRAVAAFARGTRGGLAARAEVVTGVEQLGDVALNAIDHHDKAIAITAVHALGSVLQAALVHRGGLPDTWFEVDVRARDDQDLIALHPSMVEGVQARRIWVEMKVFRQLQSIYAAALHSMRDLGHLVAIHTRRNAHAAIRADHEHGAALALRFMNTFLRAAINARDVRSAYNLLNEYRGLAEDMLDEVRPEIVEEIAHRFKYYGVISFQVDLPFLLETVAYDLCTLLERAHARDSACHDAVLALFLVLDREPEGRTQEMSLRGVRKAQVKLATYYLHVGDEPRARLIFDDMRHEQVARLQSIREELSAIDEPEYWEVSDRGINFDWLPPERRARLAEFFGWFEASLADTEP